VATKAELLKSIENAEEIIKSDAKSGSNPYTTTNLQKAIVRFQKKLDTGNYDDYEEKKKQ
jgi:hypothetical protein